MMRGAIIVFRSGKTIYDQVLALQSLGMPVLYSHDNMVRIFWKVNEQQFRDSLQSVFRRLLSYGMEPVVAYFPKTGWVIDCVQSPADQSRGN